MTTRYELADGVATITMDDGKANVLSPAMQRGLREALDRAEADEAAVVLTGRHGVFSGGFDLNVLRAGGTDAAGMVRGGFELARRLLSFPRPVVIAVSGHAVAMGLFTVLSGDHRVGVAGSEYRLVANEVAIGMTMPRSAIVICRQKLPPAHFDRVVLLSETYSHDSGVAAGILDTVVPAGDLLEGAYARARALAELDKRAHRASKLRSREGTLAALDDAIEVDDAELRALL